MKNTYLLFKLFIHLNMSHYEYVSDKEKKFLETKYKLNDLIKNYLYNSKSIEKYEDKINSIKLDNTKLFSISYTINLVDNIRKLLLLNLFISNEIHSLLKTPVLSDKNKADYRIFLSIALDKIINTQEKISIVFKKIYIEYSELDAQNNVLG